MNIISALRVHAGGTDPTIHIMAGSWLLGRAIWHGTQFTKYPWLQLTMEIPHQEEASCMMLEVAPSWVTEVALQRAKPFIRLPGIQGLDLAAWTYWTKQEIEPLPEWNQPNTVYFDDRLGEYYFWIKTEHTDPQTQEKSRRWYWQACLRPC